MNFDHFVFDLNKEQQDIILLLDSLFLAVPEVHRKMRYKIPFYYYHTWVCYLNPLKKGGQVELCFIAGQQMTDIHGLLQTKGRKMIAGISLDRKENIDPDIILDYFYEAMALTDKKGN